MLWVDRIKGYISTDALRHLMVSSLALGSFISGVVVRAKATTSSLLDPLAGTVQPMYGVPYNPPVYTYPIVKYGPPYPTTSPYTGLPPFDWNSIWSPPAWQPTAPDFGQILPSFPRLMGTIALIIFISLAAVAIISLALQGSIWRIKKI